MAGLGYRFQQPPTPRVAASQGGFYTVIPEGSPTDGQPDPVFEKKKLTNTTFFSTLIFMGLTAANAYYPSFKPNLPKLTKVITFIITTLLFTQDCVLLLNPALHTTLAWQRLKERLKVIQNRFYRHPLMLLVDIFLILLFVGFSFIASASGFANSIDAGVSTGVAYSLWFLHTLCLTQQLYRFFISIQKKVVDKLASIRPSLFSDHKRAQIAWRKLCDDLIDILSVASPNTALRTIAKTSPLTSHHGRVPLLASMTMLNEMRDYMMLVLARHEENRDRRWEKRCLRLRRVLKYALYLLMMWVCLIYTGTQMGSVHNALTEHVPLGFRDWYQEQDPKTQEYIISISVLALFMQYVRSGINAIDNVLLHIARTFIEFMRCEDVSRLFRYFLVLVSAGVLGGLSFSFVYYSTLQGMENMHFRPDYETGLAIMWAWWAKSPEGLSDWWGIIDLKTPMMTAILAIVNNTASLMECMNSLKSYFRAGGDVIPTNWRAPPRQRVESHPESYYAELAKTALLKWISILGKFRGSRYYDPPVGEETTPLLPVARDERSEAVKQAANAFALYYTLWLRPRGENAHDGVLVHYDDGREFLQR